uniref:Uncharacterized protein n=1 Tax=Rhizophora mucronata TaxID=61149 RepID=A0A2P2QT14_RHIMU
MFTSIIGILSCIADYIRPESLLQRGLRKKNC